MKPTPQRGRIIVLTVLIIILCSDICIVLLTISQKGIETSVSSIVRVFLTIGLFYAVLYGQAWARWLTVVLMSISSLAMIPISLSEKQPILFGGIILYGSAAILLSYPPSVSAYFEHHRRRSGRRSY